MKIELTIKTDYLPEWGVWEGLREIIQNAKDAEVEHYGSLKVDYLNGTVRVENTDVTLPHEALLLGHTTKSDRGDLIGKFGEGLKLGLLALTRAGKKVRIRSGSEVWVPSIEKSSKFNADVLVVDIQKGRAAKNRVRIEIPDITKEEWQEVQQRILFLHKVKEDDRIDTYSGDLLLGAKFKGRVFVKGIFVETDSTLNYGYNYKDAFDKKWRNASIWKQAVVQRPDLFESFFALVSADEADIAGVELQSSDLAPEIAEQFSAKFEKQFGEDAVPVANIEQSKDLEHLGKKGVVVNKTMQRIVEQDKGSMELVSKELREEAVRTYSWHELSEEDKSSLESAISFVRIGAESDLALSNIDIVDFRSDTLQGQFKDGRYLIAKDHLEDRDLTLEILVHEVAHECGADGDKGHVAAIEGIWSRIVKHLRDSV
jgi:hypothetical protein